MTAQNWASVRRSRDGDQFHYLWAARRCLHLISPTAELVAVTIEGSSTREQLGTGPLPGEQVIDVAEYYGSEDLTVATRVRYLQLKHSTVRQADRWTPSEMAGTLRGFAKRLDGLLAVMPRESVAAKVRFGFVSNRPVSAEIAAGVAAVATGSQPSPGTVGSKLKELTELSDESFSLFCQLLDVQDTEEPYWEQRHLLTQEVTGYLPGADMDAPIQLKELVAQRALSDAAPDPAIRKVDVLRALKTDERALFPAPNQLEQLRSAIARSAEGTLISDIVHAEDVPVVLHAEGGVGKSIFASRLALSLPPGSACVVYDCFGNGRYRSASGYRHRHKDGLVQIANELASLGLCHPLIPSPHADGTAYLNAFRQRVGQAVNAVKAANSDAVLCIVVDAADNAQMAAEEINEPRAFVRDLLREPLPGGVRLVATCRTHRQDKLDPPPQAKRLELQAFDEGETAAHLRGKFPRATPLDVAEFHRLSSRNPRVQALALAESADLQEILRSLGPNPTTVEDAIARLLQRAIQKLRDDVPVAERHQIDQICVGLATLRPLVPIPVLATMSGVEAAAIRSFAFDIGRPLLVSGETIQFFDEPAETWFRERYRPGAAQIADFVEKLQPIAGTSAYVAAALPQLMLEAGRFAELVQHALNSTALPDASPIERRDVELQRLQFALKAGLRISRYADAAKLALKAAGETAGDARQQTLIKDNVDLASAFMSAELLTEVASRSLPDAGWTGSHFAYEAALLSGRRELVAEARSSLRMAHDWLGSWARTSRDERRNERMEDDDIAALALAHLNISGARSCAGWLRGWTPRDVSFRAGKVLASRLVDAGRYAELAELALAAENDVCLVLATNLELRRVHREAPKEPVARAVRLLTDRRVAKPRPETWHDDQEHLNAIAELAVAALKLAATGKTDLVVLLTKYLPEEPPRGLSSRYGKSRFPLLRAYAPLRAALLGQRLEIADVAHPELLEELRNPAKRAQESREAREFTEDVGSLMPWHRLWGECVVGAIERDRIDEAIAAVSVESDQATARSYSNESHAIDEIAEVWMDVLGETNSSAIATLAAYKAWVDGRPRHLYTRTLTRIARKGARTAGLEAVALDFAARAFEIAGEERTTADSKAESFVAAARAVVALSATEAATYFDHAVAVASRVGDENLQRWNAILDLADRAAGHEEAAPRTAYGLARCAELTYEYVARDKHFEWEGTVEAIAGLCPSSALAILSRWRDRRFGNRARLLPVAIHRLVAQGDLAADVALALIGFRADWNESELLKHALSTAGTAEKRKAVWEFAYRYLVLDEHSEARWNELKKLAATYRMNCHDIDAFRDAARRKTEVRAARQRSTMEREDTGAKPTPDWDQVFAGVDATGGPGLAEAYQRFKVAGPPYRHEEFFGQAFRRVRPGRESDIVGAAAGLLDVYACRVFLEQLPPAWSERVAVKAAVASLIKSVCRRDWTTVVRGGRYYEPLPFDLVGKTSGLTKGEISDVILEAAAGSLGMVSAEELYALIGRLADKMAAGAAHDALEYGLGLFDDTLTENDGDGPWREELLPPTDLAGAVAGYVWAALGAPESTIRWEAAHVVRAFCELGIHDALNQLIGRATDGSAKAFADARLVFYRLNALQWLVIALARAVKDHPGMVVRHREVLIGWALHGDPHVMIRQWASEAALALLNDGSDVDRELSQRLRMVNVSPFPPVTERWPIDAGNGASPELASEDNDELWFGFDAADYQFAPLGRCFGVTKEGIERAATRVVREDWNCQVAGRWDADERVRRGVFREGEVGSSREALERTDGLHTYLCYHAMMVVAGKLLATAPERRDVDDDESGFTSWLRQHGLTRDDGKWLADRRDPPPLETVGWKSDTENDDWPWSTRARDFESELWTARGSANLWGSWTRLLGSRAEVVRVESALVSRSRSAALLNALQTVTDHHDYRIPPAGDEYEIEHGDFRLLGWLLERERGEGLDSRDPWGGEIVYPGLAPAKGVATTLAVTASPESRVWNHGSVEVMWSAVWGSFADDRDVEEEHGRRLEATREIISQLLQATEMDMIVAVDIHRRWSYSRFTMQKNERFGPMPMRRRLFLIQADGSVFAS